MARNVSQSELIRDARVRFAGVLRQHGPLPLHRVHWWRDTTPDDKLHIDFEFGSSEIAAERYHTRLEYEGLELADDVSWRFQTVWSSSWLGEESRGECTHDFERLWSEMCEDHRMCEYSRRRSEALHTLQTIGLPAYQIEVFQREIEHTQQRAAMYHGIDFGSGDYSAIILTTANEVSIRQQFANQRIQEQAREMEARVRAVFERECLYRYDPQREQYPNALTWGRVQDAMRALREPEPEPSEVERQRQRHEDVQRCLEYLRAYQNLAPFDGGGRDVGSKEAQERGKKLLLENLTPEQRTDYEKKKHFTVVGSKTGRKYRINEGRQVNIHVLADDGSLDHKLCFLPEGQLVTGDVMLAQKVALECMEEDALKVANRW